MIGRKEEIEILESCLNSKRPEFLAVYGRRRVGKTYLIREFFNGNFAFYATGIKNCNNRQKLKGFKEALVRYGDEKKTIPADWFEAFGRLRSLLEKDNVTRDFKTGKRVVFLDELPWMDSPKSDFKSALDYFWNVWGSAQNDLMLIVCGSATSWIINNIVKDTGGFYNRLTRQIQLLPFTLSECEKLLESNGMQMTRKQIVDSYMVFGGIPYYLNYLKPQFSLAQNVEMLFFKENGPLKYEFNMLFESLFNKADRYIEVIKALSLNRGGVTRKQLADSGKTVSGKELTKILEELEQCGFIRKYRNFTKKEQGCFFQLIDPLTLFYLNFIHDGKVDSWLDFIDTPGYYAWCGLAFERVCLLHPGRIKKVLGISGVTSHEFAWKSEKTDPGVQIDLLIDRRDDVINICEEKYTCEEYVIDADYEKNLQHKKEVLRAETKTKKALHLTLITFSGLKKNKHSGVVVNELTGEDLFGD